MSNLNDQEANTQNKLHKIQTILEMLIPVLTIVYPILAVIYGEFGGLDVSSWLAAYFFTLTIVVVFGFIYYRMFGFNDLRFQMFFHIVMISVGVILASLVVEEIGVYDLFKPTGRSVGEIFLWYAFYNTLPVLGIFGGLLNLFGMLKPFEREVDNLASDVQSGYLSARISNENLVKDTLLGKSVRLMNQTLDELTDIVDDVTQDNYQTVKEIEVLASSTEEVNAAIEEVSSTSQSMSQAASQQAEMIAGSVVQISELNEVVGDIIEQIQNNSDVISQIALQTNILALNAGIEASRAGDYGRGFAVVAENVRRLSEESKTAAESITEISTAISDSLTQGFGNIRIQIEEVAALSEETAASAEEVAAAAEEVTSSVEEISTTTQNISARSDTFAKKLQKYTI